MNEHDVPYNKIWSLFFYEWITSASNRTVQHSQLIWTQSYYIYYTNIPVQTTLNFFLFITPINSHKTWTVNLCFDISNILSFSCIYTIKSKTPCSRTLWSIFCSVYWSFFGILKPQVQWFSTYFIFKKSWLKKTCYSLS